MHHNSTHNSLKNSTVQTHSDNETTIYVTKVVPKEVYHVTEIRYVNASNNETIRVEHKLGDAPSHSEHNHSNNHTNTSSNDTHNDQKLNSSSIYNESVWSDKN